MADTDEQLEIVLKVKEDLKGFKEFIAEAERAKKRAEESVGAIDQMVASLKEVATTARKVAAALRSLAQAPLKAVIGIKNAVVDLGNKAKWAFTLIVAVTSTLGKKALDSASDAAESLSKVGAVYGLTTTTVINQSRKMSKELGLSYYTIAEDFGNMGALLKGFGMDAKTAAEESERAIRTAYDLASYHNLSFQEAMNKVRSGLTGETEPLKAIGIIVMEDQMKTYAESLGLVWKELDQTQKSQLRLDAIMQQAGAQGAIGDHVRTMDQYAGQVRILGENFKTLRVEIGEKVKSVVLPILQELNTNFDEIFSEENINSALELTAGIMAITGAIAALGISLKVLSTPGGALSFVAVIAAPIMYKAWEDNLGGIQDLFNDLFENVAEQSNALFKGFTEKYSSIQGLINKSKITALKDSTQGMSGVYERFKKNGYIDPVQTLQALQRASFSDSSKARLKELFDSIMADNQITQDEFISFYSEYQKEYHSQMDYYMGKIEGIEKLYTSNMKKSLSDRSKGGLESYLGMWKTLIKDLETIVGDLGADTLEGLKELFENKFGITIDVNNNSTLTPTATASTASEPVPEPPKSWWDQAKEFTENKKALDQTTTSLSQLSSSIYQVADLLEDDFLDSIGGVMSGLAGISGSLSTFAEGGGLNSVLGIFGMGSAVGGIVGSLGGNTTGGTIGGLLGAGAGFMAGGSIGAGIGSAAGGAIGGLIGGDDDEASKVAEIERKSAEIQRAASYEFSRAVDKFKEDVVDQGLGEVFDTISKLQKADADYWTILNDLQSGRRDSDEVTLDSFRKYLPTLSDEELLDFVQASIGSAHFGWDDGDRVIDTGKGSRGGIDIETLAQAIVAYNDNLLDSFEGTMESILGFTKDSVREGVQSGFQEGNIEEVLTGQVEDSLLNVFTNTKLFNSMAIGLSSLFTDSISEALGDDENLGIDLSTDGIDSIQEYIEWMVKYQEVASDEINKILDELGLIPDATSKAAESMANSISQAMSDALDANDFDKFNESLGESIYNSVKDSLIKAFAESAVYQEYIDKYMDLSGIEDQINNAGSFEDAFNIIQEYLNGLEDKLTGDGMDFGNTSGGSEENSNWESGNYVGTEANQSIVNNYYIFGPQIENLYGESKKEMFEDWEEWTKKKESETV